MCNKYELGQIYNIIVKMIHLKASIGDNFSSFTKELNGDENLLLETDDILDALLERISEMIGKEVEKHEKEECE